MPDDLTDKNTVPDAQERGLQAVRAAQGGNAYRDVILHHDLTPISDTIADLLHLAELGDGLASQVIASALTHYEAERG